ncbi:macrolide 2'-phosphotransferase [Saccharopolyspora taberi]|uniref:Mph(A) family macrolide 2'-phosphotransferase n=1 Tax=Saccharopolyspora taberi TaxID=60895 RepID=A0ABN3VN17_9PSEU
MRKLAEAHGLAVRPVDVDETGWDFRVVHAVGDDGTRWVLRVPRRPEVAELIPVEARLLEFLRRRLPVALPEWEIRSPELIAYRRLPGEPLAAEDPVVLRDPAPIEPTGDFLRALAGVIAELHRTPLAELEPLGLPVRGPRWQRAEAERGLAEARTELGVPDEKVRRWQAWIDDERHWSAEPRLVHGDLHPAHTLVDGGGALIGLLDWTDTAIDDPAADFAAPCLAFGAAGLDRLLAHYIDAGGRPPERFREHVTELTAFRSSVMLGLHGLQTGDPEYVAIARARLADQDR